MVKLLGRPSIWDLDEGLKTKKFFKRVGGGWALKYYTKNPQELSECLDLAENMLFIDGIERITPTEILKHPFIL
uniref:Protein kinase domain-containing protein n=1 Tax=Knipowitschia caucasica TaxID=637954 RepID=A0AAV2LA21_KNICA